MVLLIVSVSMRNMIMSLFADDNPSVNKMSNNVLYQGDEGEDILDTLWQ